MRMINLRKVTTIRRICAEKIVKEKQDKAKEKKKQKEGSRKLECNANSAKKKKLA
jgi:hypothetical protein